MVNLVRMILRPWVAEERTEGKREFCLQQEQFRAGYQDLFGRSGRNIQAWKEVV